MLNLSAGMILNLCKSQIHYCKTFALNISIILLTRLPHKVLDELHKQILASLILVCVCVCGSHFIEAATVLELLKGACNMVKNLE